MSRTSPYAADLLLGKPSDGSLALIFPGQGSQKTGMGRDIAANTPAARRVFEAAGEALGMDLTRLCFEGPDAELRLTANAQPAILATSIAFLVATLESADIDRRPALLAGHSLGEYTALVAAGAIGFEDAIRLVRERGRLMERAGTERPGTMVALVGLDEMAAAEICDLSGAEACNYNAPTQIVLGGTAEACAKASALAKQMGGRALPLNVSGAFHTSLMSSAGEDFAAAVGRVSILRPRIPVISNVSAGPLDTADSVRTDLKEQISKPVKWHQSVTTMIASGVKTFLEVGPGRVLTAQLQRSDPGVIATAIDGAWAAAGQSHV